jgi:hypothetical protein
MIDAGSADHAHCRLRQIEQARALVADDTEAGQSGVKHRDVLEALLGKAEERQVLAELTELSPHLVVVHQHPLQFLHHSLAGRVDGSPRSYAISTLVLVSIVSSAVSRM